ncbi:hypothetical protein PO118_20475, partial [Bacteroides thetaiotaomicron]|nr:hypothetical protein [Bacteroides thetaiotaomicron]MDC2312108.1 hypothetical protein [Bacteroides thetaiotaomicron]
LLILFTVSIHNTKIIVWGQSSDYALEIQIEEQTKNLHHESFVMRCMQWLKNALRLPTVSH